MQQGIETNGIDPKSLDIDLAMEESQESLLKIKEEMLPFREGKYSFKKPVDFEQRIIEELKPAPSIQRAIHEQLPKGSPQYVLYKQEITSIEDAFLKAKEEVTKRREYLENKGRFKYLELLGGIFVLPAAAGEALKYWFPETVGGNAGADNIVIKTLQVAIATSAAFYTTKDSRKALRDRALEKLKIKNTHAFFSSHYAKIKEYTKKKIERIFSKRNKQDNGLGL
ncbi:MAG: hypothetical protein FWF24_00520 [Alphaproteobacteria bacterium]|nr:hypothetical protein [Alphaproteobacteria bacterium]